MLMQIKQRKVSILIVMSLKESNDTAIQTALGEHLRSVRLDLNLTRDNLAAEVGLSVDTVRNAEQGRNISLDTLIRLLRGLGRLDELDLLLESRGPSPVQLAKRQGRTRQRASGSQDRNKPGQWQW